MEKYVGEDHEILGQREHGVEAGLAVAVMTPVAVGTDRDTEDVEDDKKLLQTESPSLIGFHPRSETEAEIKLKISMQKKQIVVMRLESRRMKSNSV